MLHQRQADVFLRAEGLIDGKVVATHEVRPARRPEKLILWADHEGMELKADGSDLVTVIAAVADKDGNIKHLNNYQVQFSVEGEGRLVGDASVGANPVPVKWGTAPVLIQSTTKPGKIRIVASVRWKGSQMPISAVLELESKPAEHPLVYAESEAKLIGQSMTQAESVSTTKTAEELQAEQNRKAENDRKLKEVEKQQADFGEKN